MFASTFETLLREKSKIAVAKARDSGIKRAIIWIAFVSGLFLIIIAIALFILGVGTPEVLGLASLGVGYWIALFVYKPMDRLQKAISALETFLNKYPIIRKKLKRSD